MRCVSGHTNSLSHTHSYMHLDAEGQWRVGWLDRFQFTPDRFLERGAVCRGKDSTWPRFSIPSHFIDSLISGLRSWGFQRCFREHCCVARFHCLLMVVTPNNQSNTVVTTLYLPRLLETMSRSPTSWETYKRVVAHLLFVLCKLTLTLSTLIEDVLLYFLFSWERNTHTRTHTHITKITTL